MQRTTIWFTEPIRVALTELSSRTGLSMSDLIRRAIEEYVGRHGLEAGPPRTPRALRKDRQPAAVAAE